MKNIFTIGYLVVKYITIGGFQCDQAQNPMTFHSINLDKYFIY